MSNYMRVGSDEDLSCEWSFAQVCISNAFNRGLLSVKIEDESIHCIPVCLYFGSQGEIGIIVRHALSEIAQMQPTILLTAEKNVGKKSE